MEAWAGARCAALEDGRLAEVVLPAPRSAAGSEKALLSAECVERNRARMRCAEFRAAGLCVGAGVVETGCKSARA